MKILSAVSSLSALAQESRLEAFRLLIQAGTGGMPAGKIGEKLNLPLSTLSFHLSQLKNAGLVTFRREGRILFYSANFKAMNALMGFLTENCCQGQPENCTIPTECVPKVKGKKK